jgi:proteasome assembly chaperone 2
LFEFVQPVVSLGNVPQLAVDLMIHGPHLGPIEKVGMLDSKDHIPVIGAIDHPVGLPQSQHGLNQVTTPIQVYQTRDKRYTFVQKRSPVIKVWIMKKQFHKTQLLSGLTALVIPPPDHPTIDHGSLFTAFSKARKHSHLESMKEWISAAGFDSVLVLVSVDGATRSDAHLRHPSPFFHYVPSHKLERETIISRVIKNKYASFVAKDASDVPIFSAGGLASRLLSALTSSSAQDPPSVQVNSLVVYVAEGDNRIDAKLLACEILSLFNHIRSGECSIHPIMINFRSSFHFLTLPLLVDLDGHGEADIPTVSLDAWPEPLSWKASDTYQNQTRQDLFG